MGENLHEAPYGVGLSYRYVIHDGILQHRDSIDLLELPTEDYLVRGRRMVSDPHEELLAEMLSEIPCVAHGISLSIGSVEPLDERYVEGTRRFLDEHGIRVFSEHLACHRVAGKDLTVFLPMPFEEESVDWIRRNYEAAKAGLGRPFALENVTYPFPIPHAGLSEADFFRRVTEETDATLLLDVTNVFNNAHNHGYDALEYLDRMPLDRVSQIHLAGGHFVEDRWEDSHSRPVMKPVWELYEEVLRRTDAGIVIIERDSRFEPFERVMEDVARAREMFFRLRPGSALFAGNGPAAPEPVAGNPVRVQGNEGLEQLRGFQEALFERITNPAFRAEYGEEPGKAIARFGLSDAWARRVRDCPVPGVKRLEHTWDAIADQARRDAESSEEAEWAEWARLLRETEPV